MTEINDIRDLEIYIGKTDADFYVLNDDYIFPAALCPQCGDMKPLISKASFSDEFKDNYSPDDAASVVENEGKEILSADDVIFCGCSSPSDYDDYSDYMSDEHEEPEEEVPEGFYLEKTEE